MSTKNRRSFLQSAGLVSLAAAAPAQSQRAKGMARNLTLLTIRRDGQNRLAVKAADGILDAVEAAKTLRMPAPSTIDELLQNEDGPALNALVAAAKSKSLWLKEDKIEYGPIVTRPDKIICVGLNYRAHVQESGRTLPTVPVLFNKFNNTLHSHNSKLDLPTRVATKFDYEVELVLFIGKEAKNVTEADALSYVRRLRHRQRLQRSRPPARNRRPVDDRQDPGPLRPDRPLLSHRRSNRSGQFKDRVPGQRRNTAKLEHEPDDLQLPPPDQLHQPIHHAKTGRRNLHGHSGRRN
jgi:hypothetical protein